MLKDLLEIIIILSRFNPPKITRMSQNPDISLIKTIEEKPLGNTKFITAAYNIIGLVFSVTILFYDSDLSLILLLLYPLIGITIVWFSKGIVKLISDDKDLLFGTVNVGFFLPIVFINIKSWTTYTQLPTYLILLPFIIISLTVLILLYKAGVNPLVKQNRINAAFLFILAFVYGFGSTRQINCAFDHSGAKVYNAIILRKAITTGKFNSYYLKLTPWGPVKDAEEAEVNIQSYNQTNIGDTVKVNLKQGLLHIPWFYINE